MLDRLIFNQEELGFVRRAALQEVRLDGRELNEARRAVVTALDRPGAAAAVTVQLGATHVEVALRWKATPALLSAAAAAHSGGAVMYALPNSRSAPANARAVEIKWLTATYEEIAEPGFVDENAPPLKVVAEAATKRLLRALLEVRIVCNDGNVQGAFYIALSAIFKHVCVPSSTAPVGPSEFLAVPLPAFTAVACLCGTDADTGDGADTPPLAGRKAFLTDPQAGEEEAANALIYVFTEGDRVVHFAIHSRSAVPDVLCFIESIPKFIAGRYELA